MAVMLAAATWRLTHLLMYEAGPFKLIVRLREMTGVKHEDDQPIAHPDGNIFECFLCLSIWTALILLLLVLTPVWLMVAWLATSAFAIWSEKVYKNGPRRR